MFNRFLNMSLVMVVAGYGDNLFSKTKILFGILAKKTQSILLLGSYGSTYDTNDDLNEKNVFLLEKSIR